MAARLVRRRLLLLLPLAAAAASASALLLPSRRHRHCRATLVPHRRSEGVGRAAATRRRRAVDGAAAADDDDGDDGVGVLDALALFPLAKRTRLPTARVQLSLFEERYLALVDRLLEGVVAQEASRRRRTSREASTNQGRRTRPAFASIRNESFWIAGIVDKAVTALRVGARPAFASITETMRFALHRLGIRLDCDRS